MKEIFAVLLVLAVGVSFAQGTNKVKSKRGDIQLMSSEGGSSVVCQASFNDELTILKKQGNHTLVKGSCGQGWVSNGDVEIVAKGPGDKGMKIDAVDVVGWMDNPSAVFVLDQDAGSFDGINIDRNFNDYLRNTVDREQTEMRNHEN